MEVLKLYNYENFCNINANFLDKNIISQIEEKIFDRFKNNWCARIASYGTGQRRCK